MKREFTFHRLGMRLLALAGVFVMSGTAAQGQSREISGKVTDTGGTPVVGATVVVTGTNTGTSTAANGTFRLKIPADARSLTVQFIGMKSQEVPVEKNRKVYNIKLEDEATDIEDIVVIGYGTIAKKDLTGAVSSVSGRTLASVPMSNTASALTGRLAGVQITTTDGSPDADVKIRVRGGGSITQDNSPLYIVDGFPVERISDISANDIASIDVLKDASSSAIYGARGANGVVIITTKSAQAGKTVVSYNGYAQLKYVPASLGMMDPYEFTLMQYELNTIMGEKEAESFANHFGTPDDFDIYRTMRGEDYQDQMYGRVAWGQSHNLSVSGGSAKTKFTASATHMDEDGVLITSGYQRTNLNFKLNHQLYKTVRFDVSAYYTRTVIDGAGTTANSSTEIRNAVSYRPIVGRGNWGGTSSDELDVEDLTDLETGSSLYNPIEIVQNDYKRVKRSDLNLNGALTWNIVKQLTWRSDFGMLTRDSETRRYWGPPTSTARQAGNKGVAQYDTQKSPRWRTSHTLTYKVKNFRKRHDITVMAGFEAMKETSNALQLKVYDLPTDLTPDDIFANLVSGSKENPVTTEAAPVTLASFFGRVNYSYRNKILASATFRADGSSKFAPGSQWGYFPSAALAWRISEEPFLKRVKWVNDLKVRVSFGEAGNNRISSDLWRRTWKSSFDANGIAGIGALPNVYYSPNSGTTKGREDLKWETTVTRNVGVDFSLFKGRLSGTLEGYWNTTRDLLIQSPYRTYSGYQTEMANVGTTSNRGLEITLNGVLVDKKDFSLTASFNISFNRNRVDDLGGVSQKFYKSGWTSEVREAEDYLLQVGQPIGLIYGYVTDGFYTVDDYEKGSGWKLKPGIADSQSIVRGRVSASGASGPGTLKLKKTTPVDPNDPSSYVVTSADRVIIGNANPKHTGGLNIAAAWKGFDLSAFFNWSYGNDIYNAQKIANTTTWKYQWQNLRSEFNSSNRFRYFDDAGNDLRGDKAALRELNKNATIWSPIQQSPVLHSWAVEDGSFLRLSTLTLGYTIPRKITQKWHISQLRVYATGSNLFCWTNYTGFDPEVDTRRSTPLTPGVDYSAYPKTRAFAFGINLTF